MTGGELLIRSLEAAGLRAIFGMPGTQNLAIYDAFHRAGHSIARFLVRNEQAATMTAGGYARATGRPAAALTVPGPGATNASTGVADGLNDCVPLLLVTGGIDRPIAARDRTKLFHGLDGEQFFRPITRFYACPQSAGDIPVAVASAVRAMTGVRPGPAVIELPPDVAAEESDSAPLTAPIDCEPLPPPDGQAVRQAARTIAAMQRPALLVGGDVIAADACDAVRRFAERLGAPILHTRLGKGAVPDDHPLNFGNSRTKRAREILTTADGLIAIGARFTQIDTRNWTLPFPTVIVQVDRDPRELGREIAIAAGVAGDLGGALQAILDDLSTTCSGWGTRLDAIRARLVRPPSAVLGEIRESLDRRGILVCDITSLTYRAFDEFPVFEPRTLIYPSHFVTMGYGFPAALGAKVACPERTVVALVGDGGFQMSIGELGTMAQYGIAAVVVVVVDGALTAIAASQKLHYGGRTIDVEFPNPDYIAVARAYGIHAERCGGPADLRARLQAAIALGKPALIEVPVAADRDAIEQQIPWLHGE